MGETLYIFTDGGARGNPGPAAVAFIVKNNKRKILAQKNKLIGKATNNIAEYQAVIEALKWIKENIQIFKCSNVQFFLDSKLVVNQLNGLFRVKNGNLRNLIIEVRKLEQEIGIRISYRFIPREKNRQADFLIATAFLSRK